LVKQKLQFFDISANIEIANYSFVALIKRLECILLHLNQNFNIANSVLSLNLIEDSIARIKNFYDGKFLKGFENYI
jgi:hypothetical protein